MLGADGAGEQAGGLTCPRLGSGKPHACGRPRPSPAPHICIPREVISCRQITGASIFVFEIKLAHRAPSGHFTLCHFTLSSSVAILL